MQDERSDRVDEESDAEQNKRSKHKHADLFWASFGKVVGQKRG